MPFWGLIICPEKCKNVISEPKNSCLRFENAFWILQRRRRWFLNQSNTHIGPTFHVEPNYSLTQIHTQTQKCVRNPSHIPGLGHSRAGSGIPARVIFAKEVHPLPMFGLVLKQISSQLQLVTENDIQSAIYSQMSVMVLIVYKHFSTVCAGIFGLWYLVNTER